MYATGYKVTQLRRRRKALENIGNIANGFSPPLGFFPGGLDSITPKEKGCEDTEEAIRTRLPEVLNIAIDSTNELSVVSNPPVRLQSSPPGNVTVAECLRIFDNGTVTWVSRTLNPLVNGRWTVFGRKRALSRACGLNLEDDPGLDERSP